MEVCASPVDAENPGSFGVDGGAGRSGDACRNDILLLFHGGDFRLDSRHWTVG